MEVREWIFQISEEPSRQREWPVQGPWSKNTGKRPEWDEWVRRKGGAESLGIRRVGRQLYRDLAVILRTWLPLRLRLGPLCSFEQKSTRIWLNFQRVTMATVLRNAHGGWRVAAGTTGEGHSNNPWDRRWRWAIAVVVGVMWEVARFWILMLTD